MRAVRETPDGIGVVEVSEPTGEGVPVSVAASGICSSDLPGAGWPRAVTLGHEFSGWTDDGCPVAVVPNTPCGGCDQCRAGHGQLCRKLQPTICGFFRDGGMADRIVVDPSCIAVLPETVDVHDACLVEPLAVAVHTFYRSGAGTEARVLVVGGGAIGLACVAVARSFGHDVDVLTRYPAQRRAASQLGAGAHIRSEYEIVMAAAGSQSALDAAIAHAAPGTTVALAAMFGAGATIGVELSLKEVTLVPAFTYGHHGSRSDFDEAIAVLAGNPEIASAMITHRFPLAAATQAFSTAADRRSGAIKVVLEP